VDLSGKNSCKGAVDVIVMDGLSGDAMAVNIQ
jgi:hypothetical protein